ncbi:MAG: sulfatase-like hydrolase/transferase [Oxalobacter formigenes]|nr:sulfatase-like hydrolase/transferase [Oxalobacter formigenes]
MIALFATTPAEAFGFLFAYANPINIAVLLLLIIAAFLPFFFMRRLNNRHYLNLLMKISLIAFLLAIHKGIFSPVPSKYQIAFYDLYAARRKHLYEIEKMKIAKMRRVPAFAPISSQFKNKKQTFVIVLGETSSREHFDFYGYERNTNPFLGKIKNELFLFSNVVSSDAQTHTSTQKLLSFADFSDMSPLFEKGSIIDYFNQAGFKTFWFSGQEKTGKYNNYISLVASNAHKITFYEDVKQSGKNYDDLDLLPFLQEALLDPSEKKSFFYICRGHTNPITQDFPITPDTGMEEPAPMKSS